MKIKVFLFLLIAGCVSAKAQFTTKTITFLSEDGVTVTADLHQTADTTLPYMLLFHQAGYSRGEYQETANKFMRLGFNCLAVDLRSGGEVNGVKNETYGAAKKKKKGTDYLDAEKDMRAAIDYMYARSKKKVVLVGSSYSASLALKVAVDNFKVSSVIAFSPGEYFGKKHKLKTMILNLDKPVLVLSTAGERDAVKELMTEVKSKKKTLYAPAVKGVHGSSALWKSNPNYHDYWISVMMFVEKN